MDMVEIFGKISTEAHFSRHIFASPGSFQFLYLWRKSLGVVNVIRDLTTRSHNKSLMNFISF